MVYDPFWNSFTNSGNVNDYLTYKKLKEEKIKKTKSVEEKNSNL